MLILWKPNKIGYLHIAKTAGRTTRECFLKELGPADVYSIEKKHVPLHVYIKKYNLDVSDYKLYTNIRNPYQTVVSFYFWINRNKRRESRLLNKASGMKFDRFVLWYARNRYSFRQMISIADKIPSNINFIRQENLQDELERIFEKKLELESYYVQKTPHYSNFFNRETYDIINKKFKWCFNQGLYRPV